LLSLKKNVSSKIREAKATKVMFFDEARFGTHSRRGYGWFARGTRPVVITKIGYQNFYLYGAISVNGGDNFSLILPSVNVDCMNLYLEQLSREYPQDTIALIMDGAGWHKARDLKVPENIKIIYLPPYSPELNPIERLWLYIKSKVLNNKLYNKLDELEMALCTFMQSLKNEQVTSICTANYLIS
jgi:transposase